MLFNEIKVGDKVIDVCFNDDGVGEVIRKSKIICEVKFPKYEYTIKYDKTGVNSFIDKV